MNRIQIHGWTPSEFEQMALGKMNARLGLDKKDALKAFKVGSIAVTTVEESVQHREEIERCYEVNGFMALDDSKTGRGFRFLIEKGLSWDQAKEVADQLASQVSKCIDRMITDQKNKVRHALQ